MSFSSIVAGTAISVVSSAAIGQVISTQAQWEHAAVGGKLVLDGWIQTAGNFQSDMPIQLHDLLELDVASGTSVHLGGAIANVTGRFQGLSKQGQGALTLSGTSTYYGDTELMEGSLAVGSSQALGHPASRLDAYLGTRLAYLPGVTVANTLQVQNRHSPFSPAPTGPYADSLQWQVDDGVATHQGAILLGAAAVVKQGSGMLRLTGNSPETLGRMRVDQGGLAVDGVFLGAVQVHAGAWLQGQGLLGAATIGQGGVLLAGAASPGLRVHRNLAFDPGSVLVVDVSAAGAAQPIHVQGQATLAGLLQARTTDSLASQWADGWTYPILQADGGFGDTRFDSVAVNVPFLTAGLRYDAQHVYLDLGLNKQAPALWPFSGAWAASVASALTEDSRYVRQSALRHRIQAPSTGPFIWADTFYGDAERSADNGTPGDQRRVSGVMLGMQHAWGHHGRWNAFMGMQETHLRPERHMDFVVSPPLQVRASSRITSVHAGASAAWQGQGMALSLGTAHTWHQMRSHRQLAMGGLTDALSSRYNGRTLQVFGELAADGATLTPYARLAWVQTRTQAHTEAGGPAALALRPYRQRVVFSTLGIRLQHAVPSPMGPARVHGEVAWRHAAGAATPVSRQHFASAPALADFASPGLPVSRHAIQLQAGVSAQISHNARVRLAYAGQYGRGSQEHGAQLGVTVPF